MSITIENLNKHFGNFHALKNINLNVPTGKLVSLLAHLAAAKPRCCASLPAWKLLTTAKSCSTAKTLPTNMCATEKSALCSNITPCSAT